MNSYDSEFGLRFANTLVMPIRNTGGSRPGKRLQLPAESMKSGVDLSVSVGAAHRPCHRTFSLLVTFRCVFTNLKECIV